jgi:hypothetical protein
MMRYDVVDLNWDDPNPEDVLWTASFNESGEVVIEHDPPLWEALVLSPPEAMQLADAITSLAAN